MDRRVFLGSLAGLIAAPLAAEAQQVGGAFATGAAVSDGKEVTILTILGAMLINQMIVVSGGGGFGASATTGPDSPGIDEKEVAEARGLMPRARLRPTGRAALERPSLGSVH